MDHHAVHHRQSTLTFAGPGANRRTNLWDCDGGEFHERTLHQIENREDFVFFDCIDIVSIYPKSEMWSIYRGYRNSCSQVAIRLVTKRCEVIRRPYTVLVGSVVEDLLSVWSVGDVSECQNTLHLTQISATISPQISSGIFDGVHRSFLTQDLVDAPVLNFFHSKSPNMKNSHCKILLNIVDLRFRPD